MFVINSRFIRSEDEFHSFVGCYHWSNGTWWKILLRNKIQQPNPLMICRDESLYVLLTSAGVLSIIMYYSYVRGFLYLDC